MTREIVVAVILCLAHCCSAAYLSRHNIHKAAIHGNCHEIEGHVLTDDIHVDRRETDGHRSTDTAPTRACFPLRFFSKRCR